MSMDYAARLASVQAAIEAILAGRMAEYTLDGQRVTYLDLGTLQAEEQRLLRILSRASRRGGAFGHAVPR